MIVFYKALKFLYASLFKGSEYSMNSIMMTPNEASSMIKQLLLTGRPCMIARFGAFELASVANYLSVNAPSHSLMKYIKGEQFQWWWNESNLKFMESNAGFFPSNYETISRFSELMLNDAKELDLLGSWLPNERFVEDYCPGIPKVKLVYLEPYLAEHPWTEVLEGKRVLVVHPFAELIEKQYNYKREYLFKNPAVLPNFHLETIEAVQSMGGGARDFKNWFEALEWMKTEIDKHNYDVCLLGCGAYGFPLAAHIKRMGKQAIHLGGALQLLFGIKGKRWEEEDYSDKCGLPHDTYKKLLDNEYWVRPNSNLQPAHYKRVEGACYW